MEDSLQFEVGGGVGADQKTGVRGRGNLGGRRYRTGVEGGKVVLLQGAGPGGGGLMTLICGENTNGPGGLARLCAIGMEDAKLSIFFPMRLSVKSTEKPQNAYCD